MKSSKQGEDLEKGAETPQEGIIFRLEGEL
jgi:hypothetical protein